eukprot:3333708-Pleurochrysis_carterae.AAC.1
MGSLTSLPRVASRARHSPLARHSCRAGRLAKRRADVTADTGYRRKSPCVTTAWSVGRGDGLLAFETH